jgi:hypothetical protein
MAVQTSAVDPHQQQNGGRVSLGNWSHNKLADALKSDSGVQWRTEGGSTPPPPEIPKLGKIQRSVENKSVTT